MKRIEKITDEVIKFITLPIRVGIGIYNAVEKNTPDKLEIPFELKRKEKSKWSIK